MGIQENKNQFDGANVPIELTRLVQCMKKEKAVEIREYFRVCLEQDSQPDSQPEPESQPEPQPDVQPEPQPDVQPESQPDVQPESQPDVQPDVQPESECQEDSRFERVQSWIEKGLEESCILYLYKPTPEENLWGHDDDYDVEIRCNSAVINIKTDSQEAYNDLKNSLIDFIGNRYEEDEDGCLWS
jgi:hypothetical protein